MRRAGAAAALALATLAAPAHVGFPVESEETCPVGGEKFTYTTTGSYSVFGQRPDGKPYGSWMFPLMRKVIDAGDASSTPLDLMSADFAGNACADLIEADAAAPLPERCNDPKVRERTQKVLGYRKNRAANDGPTAGEVMEAAEEAAED